MGNNEEKTESNETLHEKKARIEAHRMVKRDKLGDAWVKSYDIMYIWKNGNFSPNFDIWLHGHDTLQVTRNDDGPTRGTLDGASFHVSCMGVPIIPATRCVRLCFWRKLAKIMHLDVPLCTRTSVGCSDELR